MYERVECRLVAVGCQARFEQMPSGQYPSSPFTSHFSTHHNIFLTSTRILLHPLLLHGMKTNILSPRIASGGAIPMRGITATLIIEYLANIGQFAAYPPNAVLSDTFCYITSIYSSKLYRTYCHVLSQRPSMGPLVRGNKTWVPLHLSLK